MGEVTPILSQIEDGDGQAAAKLLPLDAQAIFNVARKIESDETRQDYLNQDCGDR